MSNTDLITFERFTPGSDMGEASVAVDQALVDSLQKVYGFAWKPAEPLPMALCTVLMMRAYLQVVTPRPPGNVHGRQWLQAHAPLRVGDTVRTRVRCLSRELKSGRRWVQLEALGSVAQQPAYTGRLTLLWAA